MLYVDDSFEITAELSQAKYYCSLFHFLLPDFKQGNIFTGKSWCNFSVKQIYPFKYACTYFLS